MICLIAHRVTIQPDPIERNGGLRIALFLDPDPPGWRRTRLQGHRLGKQQFEHGMAGREPVLRRGHHPDELRIRARDRLGIAARLGRHHQDMLVPGGGVPAQVLDHDPDPMRAQDAHQ